MKEITERGLVKSTGLHAEGAGDGGDDGGDDLEQLLPG